MSSGRTLLAFTLASAGIATLACLYDPLGAAKALAPSSRESVGTASLEEHAADHDPDGSMARELARTEGVSLEEAKLRLRLMVEANPLARALAQRYQDKFVGISFVSKPSFHVMAYFAHVDVRTIEEEVKDLAGSAELRAALKLEGTPYSNREMADRGDHILRIVQSVDPKASLARPVGAGDVKITVEDPDDFKARLQRSSQSVKDALQGIEIEQFSGITPT